MRVRNARRSRGEAADDGGFTVIELLVAAVIMVIVMTSLTYVLVNSMVDAGYNRQRAQATSIANQFIEEIRALPWSTLSTGMSSSDPTLAPSTSNSGTAVDGNVSIAGSGSKTTYCYEDAPLAVDGTVRDPSLCSPEPWSDPACMTSSGLPGLPTVSNLTGQQPLNPHQSCYKLGNTVYGVDVYVTGGTGKVAPPLTATVVVAWSNPLRRGLSDHVVTTTTLSDCLTVGTNCS